MKKRVSLSPVNEQLDYKLKTGHRLTINVMNGREGDTDGDTKVTLMNFSFYFLLAS